MKATLTFDLSNKDELQEYNNLMASKDLIKAIQKLYFKTERILNEPPSINTDWANTVNKFLYCALADYNLDIRQFGED